MATFILQAPQKDFLKEHFERSNKNPENLNVKLEINLRV